MKTHRIKKAAVLSAASAIIVAACAVIAARGNIVSVMRWTVEMAQMPADVASIKEEQRAGFSNSIAADAIIRSNLTALAAENAAEHRAIKAAMTNHPTIQWPPLARKAAP